MTSGLAQTPVALAKAKAVDADALSAAGGAGRVACGVWHGAWRGKPLSNHGMVLAVRQCLSKLYIGILRTKF